MAMDFLTWRQALDDFSNTLGIGRERLSSPPRQLGSFRHLEGLQQLRADLQLVIHGQVAKPADLPPLVISAPASFEKELDVVPGHRIVAGAGEVPQRQSGCKRLVTKVTLPGAVLQSPQPSLPLDSPEHFKGVSYFSLISTGIHS